MTQRLRCVRAPRDAFGRQPRLLSVDQARLNMGANVFYWHLADIKASTVNVRFWG